VPAAAVRVNLFSSAVAEIGLSELGMLLPQPAAAAFALVWGLDMEGRSHQWQCWVAGAVVAAAAAAVVVVAAVAEGAG
jgi:hypothetical protein